MNWLLPAVAVFLILAAWDGHRKGFIKKLVGIVSTLLTLLVTHLAAPVVADFLREHTQMFGEAEAFLITLLPVSVLIKGVAVSLDIAAKLPVLHGLNKLAGLVFGLAEGILAVWIFFFVITVFSMTDWGGSLLNMVSGSPVLTWLYEENALFALL